MLTDLKLKEFPRDGSKKFPCPAITLSWDKKSFLVPLSLCPWTRVAAKIPGQAPLSLDIPQDKMALFCTLLLFSGKSLMGEIEGDLSCKMSRWDSLKKFKSDSSCGNVLSLYCCLLCPWIIKGHL